MNSLAKTFKRTAFAIEARLEKLESDQPGAEKRGYRIIRSSGVLEPLIQYKTTNHPRAQVPSRNRDPAGHSAWVY